MVEPLIPCWDDQAWRQQLIAAITQPIDLFNILGLGTSLIEEAEGAWRQFKLRVPRAFVAKMQAGNPNDPLLLQVLPVAKELELYPGYQRDPLQEAKANPIPGLLHKYHGRVLLTVAGSCGINCRYCFRRHFPYQDNNPGLRGWLQALRYIANDDSIDEVILSGGDPLVADDSYLEQLIQHITAIPHVSTLRIHSRMPIVLPERITGKLLNILANCRLKIVMVSHCNHPNELDSQVASAMQLLRQANVHLLNQSVLLKGVNNETQTLVDLSHGLFKAGIMPYYLHMLDKVAGSAHFEVPETEAISLMQHLQQRLPGYLVPRLVKEIPGIGHKVPVEISKHNPSEN